MLIGRTQRRCHRVWSRILNDKKELTVVDSPFRILYAKRENLVFFLFRTSFDHKFQASLVWNHFKICGKGAGVNFSIENFNRSGFDFDPFIVKLSDAAKRQETVGENEWVAEIAIVFTI